MRPCGFHRVLASSELSIGMGTKVQPYVQEQVVLRVYNNTNAATLLLYVWGSNGRQCSE